MTNDVISLRSKRSNEPNTRGPHDTTCERPYDSWIAGRTINGPMYEFSAGGGRVANLVIPGSHEPYQFGSAWEVALYEQDPDRFAANYFGMTVPEYRKWVTEPAPTWTPAELASNLKSWLSENGLSLASDDEVKPFLSEIGDDDPNRA